MTPTHPPEDTLSLCPVCLARLPARRVLEGGVVRLERTCPEHGVASVPVWRGEPAMAAWRRPKTPSPPNPGAAADKGCPFDCGLCQNHAQHTCTALVEITSRCNLGCPVCFASSGDTQHPAQADPSAAELAAMLRHLRARAGACNLQLSGGEPTVRDDLEEIVGLARAAGFGFVQLNTNGLRLAGEEGYARRLARAGLASVFLQYDGSDEACLALRGRPLKARKLAAVRACEEAGLGVVLVPTVARGVNEGQLGDIVRQALALGPVVRGVHFQPMAAFGRHQGQGGERGLVGPTLPEMLSLLVAQCEGLISMADLHPPGCEHALCSFSGTFARQGQGLAPVGGATACCDPAAGDAGEAPTALEGALKSRAFTARQWAAPDKPQAGGALLDDFDRFLARAGAHNRFTISCMAFQDAWSIDLERARGCCIHVLAPDGALVPFCLYNLTAADGRTLHRGKHGPRPKGPC